jgi:hypothetical protein
MYHVSPTKVLHFGGLDAGKRYDLQVRLPFFRGRFTEFTVEGVAPGKRITIDCRPSRQGILAPEDGP